MLLVYRLPLEGAGPPECIRRLTPALSPLDTWIDFERGGRKTEHCLSVLSYFSSKLLARHCFLASQEADNDAQPIDETTCAFPICFVTALEDAMSLKQRLYKLCSPLGMNGNKRMED